MRPGCLSSHAHCRAPFPVPCEFLRKGVVLRHHPDIEDSDRTGGSPTTTREMASSRRLHDFPSGPGRYRRGGAGRRPSKPIRSVKPDGVGLLDLDNPVAANARYPKHVCGTSDSCNVWADGPGGFGQTSAIGFCSMASQYSGGIGSPGPEADELRGSLPTADASFSICFGVGMRQLAGRSAIK